MYRCGAWRFLCCMIPTFQQRVTAGLIATLVAVLLAPASAGAAPPTATATVDDGSVCRGSARSLADDGTVVGSASGEPGSTSSSSSPFVVDASGRVAWEGSIDEVFGSGTANVHVGGVPVLDDEFTNRVRRQKAGTIDLGDKLLIAVRGPRVWSEFRVEGTKADCTGGIWVEFDGSPVGTIPWIAALAATLLGLAGIATARPRRIR
jgi:hypothetical protein